MYKKIPEIKRIESFLSKISVDRDTECWNWIAGKCRDGYGIFSIKTNFKAHRVSWSIFVGDIDSCLVIDHLCKNRACVNPDHLRQVTLSINSRENSNSPYGKNYVKTHCKNGHEYDKHNTYPVKNGRACRKCRSISRKKLRDKKRR